MSYLVTQMWMCLLAAGLLGFVIGWLLKQLGLGGKLEELETSWKSRLAGVEGERDKLKADASALKADVTKSETGWTGKYAGLSAEYDKSKLALAGCEKKYAALDEDWKAKWAKLDAEMKKLAAGQDVKFAAAEQDLAAWKLKFAELDKSAGASKADHDSLNAKLSAGAAALAAAEAARIALGNDSKKLAAELEAEKAKHISLEAEWKSRWAARDGELASTKAKLVNLEKSNAGSKGEQDSLNAKLAAGAAALAAVEATRQSLTSDVKKLAAQLEEEKGKNSKVKAEIELKNKQDQAVHDHEEHDKFAAAEANWKSRWVALEKERDGLKVQLDATGRHDSVLQSQLNEANAKLTAGDTEWRTRWTALEQERNTLKDQLDSAGKVESLEKDGAGRVAILEAELDKLRKVKPTVVGDIEDIEGIGPFYGDKLRGVGIAWIKQLLVRGANKEGREEIATASGIAHPLILKWTNMADLLRLWGVTPNWAELLEASGVDTVKEIKHRVPDNLLAKMTEVNAVKRLAPTLPAIELVTSWVEQAKAVPPILTY